MYVHVCFGKSYVIFYNAVCQTGFVVDKLLPVSPPGERSRNRDMDTDMDYVNLMPLSHVGCMSVYGPQPLLDKGPNGGVTRLQAVFLSFQQG